jgi:hypothetical protein
MRLPATFAFVVMLMVPFGSDTGGAAATPRGAVAPDPSVLTYHGDNLRTGWDRHETVLNAANVNSASFGLLATVPLDDQVDAEPLVVQSQTITAGPSPGAHDVVYVVTESDSVYAIDAESGAVLIKTTLGVPLPETQLPGKCYNNGANIGINSTPVIDRASQTLYLIADTFESGHAVFRIHALDLGSLVDKTAPVVVSATRRLSNGTPYKFTAGIQRQRAALLESGGNVYAGFASFCDFAANRARGFVLGWQAATLAPLAANELTDSAAASPNSFFLASVWMSGYGLAADESGSVYFSTGNSDASSYDMGAHDIQESVVRLSPDLSTMQSFFTPANYATLDGADMDLGSGGVLLVPYQTPGPVHDLAVAGGKDGHLYVLDRNALGGYVPAGSNALSTVAMGYCWCGQSYFVGSDLVPRIVTGGNRQIVSWRLQTAPAVALTQESVSPVLPSVQDPGLFTTVSSNGTASGSAVVWTVTRPDTRSPATVSLDALDPATEKILFSAVAGTWPSVDGNANIVPTVFNGRVYVASFGQLAIFGLLPAGSKARVALAPQARRDAAEPGVQEVYGFVETASGSRFLLRAREERISVDATAAARASLLVRLYPGEAVFVRGRFRPPNSLEAISVARAKSSPTSWAPDH